jgi:hypothetical protein
MAEHSYFGRRIIAKVFRTADIPAEANKEIILTIDSLQGFRISFEVDKNITSEPNKATVHIYNLSEETRKSISSKGLWLELTAGYVDNLSLVYAGAIATTNIRKENADIVTHIVCRTDWNLKNIIYRNAFIGNTNIKSILLDILQYSKIPCSHILVEGDAGDRGWCFANNVEKILNQLADWFKFSWSMQDYGFFAIDDKMVLPVNIQIESPLIDVTLLPREDDRTSVGFDLTCFLDGTFQIGYNVSFSSKYNENNDFKVYKIRHQGDTHTPNWQTNLMGYKAGSLIKKPDPSYFSFGENE